MDTVFYTYRGTYYEKKIPIKIDQKLANYQILLRKMCITFYMQILKEKIKYFT